MCELKILILVEGHFKEGKKNLQCIWGEALLLLGSGAGFAFYECIWYSGHAPALRASWFIAGGDIRP